MLFQNFKPARVCKNKSWYVEYYAYCPKAKKLKNVRIKLNHIKNKKERNKYALYLVEKINRELYNGFNPFIKTTNRKKFSEVIDEFFVYQRKRLKEGIIRQNTYKDYRSNINTFCKWLNEDIYVQDFNRKLITRFLDYVFIEKDLTAQTHNNYLNNLRALSSFLVYKGYLEIRPTDNIRNIRTNNKRRTVITEEHLKTIFEHLKEYNKPLFLASNILYYAFIRPIEMTNLKIIDISYKQRLIHLNKEFTKNKRDAAVTIPKTLLKIMIDAKLHEYPSDFYVFSKGLIPGTTKIHPKSFRAAWKPVCRKLGMPETYQFYSLKDTGITQMIKTLKDPYAVSTQARHHSLDITEKYVGREVRKADPLIKDL